MLSYINKILNILIFITPFMSIISVVVAEYMGVGELSFVKKTYSDFDVLALFRARLIFETINQNQYTRINPVVFVSHNENWREFKDKQEDLLFLYNMSCE